MAVQTRSVKDASTALSKWLANTANAAGDWANGIITPRRDPFDPNVVDPDAWQAGVSTPEAKTGYQRGMVSVDRTLYNQLVSTTGKTNYTANTRAKQKNYSDFATVFLPALSGEIDTLNRTNPRGPRGTNRGRMLALQDWYDSKRGSFRVR
jgi:hypothetical protein